METLRTDGRACDMLRPIILERAVNRYAEGSALIRWGNTHVLCTASVDDKVPPFLRGSGNGWITAEYAMLPRSTQSRMQREISRGKRDARGSEIQRLIGRSLRAATATFCRPTAAREPRRYPRASSRSSTRCAECAPTAKFPKSRSKTR